MGPACPASVPQYPSWKEVGASRTFTCVVGLGILGGGDLGASVAQSCPPLLFVCQVPQAGRGASLHCSRGWSWFLPAGLWSWGRKPCLVASSSLGPPSWGWVSAFLT